MPHHHGHPDHHDDRMTSRAPGVAAVAGRHGVTVDLERAILDKNDRLAAQNRAWFEGREVAGAQSRLFARRRQDLAAGAHDPRSSAEIPICVIEGDQQTENDARAHPGGRRAPPCRSTPGPAAISKPTWSRRALDALRPPFGAVVMIENVGNLVCPALFDLGEAAKVVVLSVTEGDDKPLKYPHMFRAADLMIVSKIDLAPHVALRRGACEAEGRARSIRRSARSACRRRRARAWKAWYDWLRAARLRRSRAGTVAAYLTPARSQPNRVFTSPGDEFMLSRLSNLFNDDNDNLRARSSAFMRCCSPPISPPGRGRSSPSAIIRCCSARRCSPTASACGTPSTPTTSPPSTMSRAN